MRIGFVSHWYDPEGGAAAGPGTIARALARRGHDVQVVTGYPIYPEGKVFAGYRNRPYMREVMDDVTVHRFPIYPSHDDRAGRRMLNYASFAASGSVGAIAVLRTCDVNFVYSTPATAAAPALATKRAHGTPFVVQIQDLWPQTVLSSGFVTSNRGARLEKVIHRFCDAVYRQASRVAVTSPGMADLIASRGVEQNKLRFVPNWADEEAFRPAPRDPDLATSLGLDRTMTVMYAGNLGEMQNLSHLVSAAARLRDLEDMQIAFVGAGVREGALKRQAQELRLDNVRFVKAQPFSRMADILALGDIQVVSLKDVPLYRSTLPSKLQANMAAARPVLAAVAGDAADVVERSGCGMTVRPGDDIAMAEAIRSLHKNPGDLDRMAAAAREQYLSTFSESESGDQLESLLAQAAEETT